MTFAAVAVGVAGAAAGVAGGMMQAGAQKSAANKAADAQVQGQQMAIASNEAAANRAMDTLRPWEESGYGAQNKLNYLLGTDTPLALPNKNDFTFTDTLGTQRFDQQGYNNAMRHFAIQAQQAGIDMPQAPDKRQYQKALYSKSGKIRGYTLDKAAWKQANLDYKGASSKFYAGLNSPDTLAKIQQAQSQQGGERGSLLHDFNAEDYQKEPGYTPFVNTLEDLQNTPGYQFRLAQGEQALNRGAAARGGLLSGAAAKEMDRYGQGFASTEYQSAWDRAQSAYQNAVNRYNTNRQTKYNMLSGQGQQGQSAATGMAGIAQNAGQQSAQINQNTANQLASINLANGQAQADMWGNVANSVNSGIGNAVLMNSLNNRGGWGNGSQPWQPGNPLYGKG